MVNKITLLGYVGGTPEFTQLDSGATVARLSIATSDTWKDANGVKQEQTEWHNVVFWNNKATVVNNYVKKGSRIYVEGKLTHRKYEKDGITYTTAEVVCRELKLLDNKEN